MLKRWNRRTSWIALGIALLCGIVLTGLVLTNAVDKQSGWISGLVLLALGGVSGVAALIASSPEPLPRYWTGWLQPRTFAVLLTALFAGFGVMTDALGLFEPRPVVESEPLTIENSVARIEHQVATLVPAKSAIPRIRTRLPGLWGNDDCKTVFRFERTGEALTVDAVKRPAGEAPWRLVASVVDERGDALQVTGESPAEARGKAAVFTYATNGLTEIVTWDDKVSRYPSKLVRCG